jgi:hypothetical protein
MGCVGEKPKTAEKPTAIEANKTAAAPTENSPKKRYTNEQ